MYGDIVEDYIDRNLIVSGARTIITELLGGGTEYITKIGMGIGTSNPAETDTGLTDPSIAGLVYGTITSVTYPTTSSVMFSWTLDYDEGNGFDITEYGLFSTDDILFSRKTKNAISKDSTLSFEGEWTIEF